MKSVCRTQSQVMEPLWTTKGWARAARRVHHERFHSPNHHPSKYEPHIFPMKVFFHNLSECLGRCWGQSEARAVRARLNIKWDTPGRCTPQIPARLGSDLSLSQIFNLLPNPPRSKNWTVCVYWQGWTLSCIVADVWCWVLARGLW